MYRYRFARQPRWILGHVLVALAVVVMVNLGFWQLRRLDERRAANELVEARARQPVAALTTLVPQDAGAGVGVDVDEVEFRRATATGTFDARHEVLVGYRSSNGLPGFHVVTPLVLGGGDGRTVLVNRGFVPLALADRWPVVDAAPPTGEVTVVGVVRGSDGGGHRPAAPVRSATTTTKTPRTNAVDVTTIAAVLPAGERARLLPMQIELEQPVPPGFPDPLPPLEPGEGPHLSYAVQWFAFSSIAIGGWIVVLSRQATRAAPTGHAHDDPAEPSADH